MMAKQEAQGSLEAAISDVGFLASHVSQRLLNSVSIALSASRIKSASKASQLLRSSEVQNQCEALQKELLRITADKYEKY